MWPFSCSRRCVTDPAASISAAESEAKSDIDMARCASVQSIATTAFPSPGRRRKKGKAPAPPLSPESGSRYSTSINITIRPLVPLSPLGDPPTLPAKVGLKRKYVKSKPAPMPPPLKATLTRSMTDPDHLNPFDDIKPPQIPKKTFDAIALFGCDMNSMPSSEGTGTSASASVDRKTLSLPLNVSSVLTNPTTLISKACGPHDSCEEIYENENIYENLDFGPKPRNLKEPLSPPKRADSVNEPLAPTVADVPVNSPSTVIQFIKAFSELKTEMKLTEGSHLYDILRKSLEEEREDGVNGDDDKSDSSEGRVTIISMPTKWKYCSTSNTSESSTSSDSTLKQQVLPPLPCLGPNQGPKALPRGRKNVPKATHSAARRTVQSNSLVSSSSALSGISSPPTPASPPTRTTCPRNRSRSHWSCCQWEGESQDASGPVALEFGKPPLCPTPGPRNNHRKKGETPLGVNAGQGGHPLITQTDNCENSEPLDSQHLERKGNRWEMFSPGSSQNPGGGGGAGRWAPNMGAEDKSWSEQAQIGRLMQQLETAIAFGQHRRAAVLARELALRKVTCTLNRSSRNPGGVTIQPITVYLYIEDKTSHEGPIPMQVYPTMSLRMLKLKVEKDFGFPFPLQRWILGKSLATDEEASLTSYGVTSCGCPVFLYLLSPEEASVLFTTETPEQPIEIIDTNLVTDTRRDVVAVPEEKVHEDTEQEEAVVAEVRPNDALEKDSGLGHEPEVTGLQGDVVENDYTSADEGQVEPQPEPFEPCEPCYAENYSRRTEVTGEGQELTEVEKETKPEEVKNPETYQQLVQLDDVDLVPNTETFECPICLTDVEIGDGIVLRDCLHTFCTVCLVHAVEYGVDAEVSCPFRNEEYSCDSRLQEREIKALVSAELFERYLQRSMRAAESRAEKSFHCKTTDCPAWCQYDDNVNTFPCPVCRHENCLTCQAIHEDMNCRQYQDQLDLQAYESEDAKKTKEYLDNMVAAGEATRCPQCRVIVMKKWGCDWIKCSMCQTEICWVTKGPRWGPGGRGDTSAGCKCMLNGKRCHPKCNYCH